MANISSPVTLLQVSPLDAKSCNWYVSGADIVIETIPQYLARVTINRRYPAGLVAILLPKEGYSPTPSYPYADFKDILVNFDCKFYHFKDGLYDVNFVEFEVATSAPISDNTPVDTDEVVSLRGTSWLKTTWTVLKAFLKTYFDSIYSAINHTHTFVSLTDTPASYSGAGGKIMAVNSGATGLEFVDAPSGGGAMSIIDHSTGAFTLALTDAENYLTCNYASGFVVTVPKNSVVAFPVGTTICLEQTGNGAITMAPVDVDVTLVAYDGLTSYGQYAVLTLVKKGTDLWTVIAGTGF